MRTRLHRRDREWTNTRSGEPRGFIDSHELREVWFHMGTVCNLNCPGCFEHSAPGNNRLDMLTFADATPFLDEAVELGVEQFSFTGGEPFLVPALPPILDYALDSGSCLVLTNGTLPARLPELRPLADKPNPLSFRVSLDFPDRDAHDALRGHGMFDCALDTLGKLARTGFHVSVARRRIDGEDRAETDAAYRPFLKSVGLSASVPVISFPDLEAVGTPEIAENCMAKYHTEESREKFMCAFSRMVVKKEKQMRVYACTLVDDQPLYDLGGTLKESTDVRVMLGHSRCFACFSGGTSCSEI